MAIKKFRLSSKAFVYTGKDSALKGYYRNWRSVNRATNKPFIALYNSFKDEHLKDLEAGPLRLYLFFSFAANNKEGHSWHSIKSIADFFGTQTRTIDNWIKTLVDKDLIYREQTDKKSNTTYLIPYSNSLVRYSSPKKMDKDEQKSLDSLIKNIEDLSSVYGQIIRVHHFFQWKTKNRSPDKNQSSQAVFIITRRSNGILTGHIYKLNQSDHLGVSELNIEDDIAVFDSPFQYNGTNVIGLALPHETQFMKNPDAVLELMQDLSETEDWQLYDEMEVEYGKKEQVLLLEDKTEKEDIEDKDRDSSKE